MARTKLFEQAGRKTDILTVDNHVDGVFLYLKLLKEDSAHADGTRAFDYRGSSYSLLLDGTYAFNEKISATLGFRHTEALGAMDYAGDYSYDSVGLMLKHQLAANQTVGLGCQFYDFNNHDGGSLDDYRAHGAFITYTYTF